MATGSIAMIENLNYGGHNIAAKLNCLRFVNQEQETPMWSNTVACQGQSIIQYAGGEDLHLTWSEIVICRHAVLPARLVVDLNLQSRPMLAILPFTYSGTPATEEL